MMKPSLNDYVYELSPWLPPEMVHPDYLNAIKNIALTLPPVPFGCFETWLSPEVNRVDFNVLVRGKTNEYRWFVESGQSSKQKEIHINDYDTSDLCAQWSRPDFYLRSFIHGFWMIYDLNFSDSNAVRLWHYPELAKTIFEDDNELKVEIPIQILKTLPLRVDKELLAQTHQFIAGLPAEIQVHCIGPNLRESKMCLRFSLVAPTLSSVCTFLKQHNWPGNLEELKKLFKPIDEFIAYYGFGVDVGPDLMPTVGIKVFFGNSNVVERVKAVVTYLCSLGLCNQQKGNALVNWHGQSEVELQHLSAKKTLKRMVYLKFVCTPGSTPFVKAYNCYFTTD